MKITLHWLIGAVCLCFLFGCASTREVSMRQDVKDTYIELTQLEKSFNASAHSDYKTTVTRMPEGLVLFGHDETMGRADWARRLFDNNFGSAKTDALLTALYNKYGINESFMSRIKSKPSMGRVYSLKDNEYLHWKYGAEFKH
jgi:hypothetical protein